MKNDFSGSGMEGLSESPRSDVREEVYIRLIMRMMGLERDDAREVIRANGGVDKFAAMVQGQSPEAAWENMQNAGNVGQAAKIKGFDPDLY